MRFKPGGYARLTTERPNTRSRHIDLLTPLEAVRLINREDCRVARAVGRQAPAMARAAALIARSLGMGARAFFVGAGTSGRLGVLEAAECPPTFGTRPSQIRAVMAGGRASVFSSREGAEDDARAGTRAMAGLRPDDVVVGIAASGVTPFVRAALAAASRKGVATILVTSSRLSGRPADVVIAPQVGPEVIAGSTRLKCGTAAKMVLNTLTTAAMIRCGKVYDHWMVDLRPTSRKLKLRALRLIAHLGAVSQARSRALFKYSGGNVKAAVVMARRRISAASARRLLKNHGGSLRIVLESR